MVKVFKRSIDGEKGSPLFGGSSFRSRFVFYFFDSALSFLIEMSLSAEYLEPCAL